MKKVIFYVLAVVSLSIITISAWMTAKERDGSFLVFYGIPGLIISIGIQTGLMPMKNTPPGWFLPLRIYQAQVIILMVVLLWYLLSPVLVSFF